MANDEVLVLAMLFFAALTFAPSAIKSVLLARRQSQFNCTMCGNCCRFKIINLIPSDIKRLEDAGHRDFAVTDGEVRLKRVNGRCVFNKGDTCSVHEHRPKVCREFPFFKTWGIGYAREATFCPAMDNLKDE